MDKPDFQEVIEDLPVVTFATQLRRLDKAVELGMGALVQLDDLRALLSFIKERDHRACWFTTCKSCAGLWDKVYEYDMERQALRSALEALVDEQNGPPLLRDKERWEAAMANADKALGREDEHGAT